MKLTIIPFEDVDSVVVQQLIEDMAFLKLTITFAEPIELPQHGYNAVHRQYHANVLLNQIRHYKGEHLIGITDTDLNVENLNFVFGLADLPGRACVISTFRLHFSASEQEFRERVVKEAVHEFGHTLGLHHCQNSRCVMHFSNSLLDTDHKSKTFCPQCVDKLPDLADL